jgi:hypothetical protein
VDAVQPLEVVRPWRRAAIAAAAVAVVELVALVVLGLALLAGPLARSVGRHEAAKPAAVPAPAAHRPVAKPVSAPQVARLSRAATRILVLNGNGRAGAASSESLRLQVLGYRTIVTGNATRPRTAPSIVMFRPGYRPEALRVARDLGVKLVGPLDGVRARDLRGAQVLEILGT